MSELPKSDSDCDQESSLDKRNSSSQQSHRDDSVEDENSEGNTSEVDIQYARRVVRNLFKILIQQILAEQSIEERQLANHPRINRDHDWEEQKEHNIELPSILMMESRSRMRRWRGIRNGNYAARVSQSRLLVNTLRLHDLSNTTETQSTHLNRTSIRCIDHRSGNAGWNTAQSHGGYPTLSDAEKEMFNLMIEEYFIQYIKPYIDGEIAKHIQIIENDGIQNLQILIFVMLVFLYTFCWIVDR